MNISVVVPLLNEEESLSELVLRINSVLQAHNFSFEIIFIDDGSRDGSWKMIENLSAANANVKGVKFRRNFGKSAALNEGFAIAQGDVVITMDADLQDSPEEIPELYRMITEQGFDLVSGWKKKRHDPIGKTIPSQFFNFITRRISGIKLHDFNCGLKAYRSDVVKNIEIYGEMHRYIPVIAKWAGFKNIGEKIVEHRPRKYGYTKFGMERFVNGYLDLLSITFVSKFGRKPMHLFGFLGTLIFIAGFFIAGYLAYGRLFQHIYKMTERPLFYFGLLAMVLGTLLFLAGFLAEMIARNSNERNKYQIEKRIG